MDVSLPGGLFKGKGNIRHVQPMAFTALMAFETCNVFNPRSDLRSAFAGLFRSHRLWAATALSVAFHVAIIYTPFLPHTFSAVSLSACDWLVCVGSAVPFFGWKRRGSGSLGGE